MLNQGMFSSNSSEWETPQDLFDSLNRQFHFSLDACATPQNAKCQKFYSIIDDGLAQPWESVTWCNPPYGRDIINWVEKAYTECMSNGAASVLLLPARTDTRWFHDYIYRHEAQHIYFEFLRGRLKFGDSQNSAPFPSMVVHFIGNSYQ